MITLENVFKTYKTGDVETHALRGVSLSINDGEFIVILGPSGSGKSTLLNVISGLDNITSGSIKFNGEEISKYKEDKLTEFRRDNLGFIFQQYNLLQNLTVYENIQMGADLSKNPLDINETLKHVGLESSKDKYPSQLSGGQQQRVSIARSVVKNPSIMFCDEPTGALDEETAKQVLNLLQKLNKELKTTTVIITHNPSIANMADTVIRMNSGKIEEIYKNKEKLTANELKWS
ncbi:ABC transporter ATP-binding protein [Clostridium sp. LIBA-8841]|uniref:ABC transporter ATP-binding protein n=1 Tax=Clostridium sp. LIBA-8841 TaxID=2987530 RepID=UPI002AC7241F|nr:ABC transporter ATP-binding protein [Clostridium sp. LIBA-8841]MDZ5254595.1 ABC transporter ATP-binding protein [Clostridium sp. LIBA-8841]